MRIRFVSPGARPEYPGMTLGTLLKKRRLERGLTLEAVALEAGTNQGNLSRIERDTQQPSAALLRKIAKALGVTVSSLYEELDSAPAGIRETPPSYSKQLQQLQRGFLTLTPDNQKLAVEFIKLLGRMQKQVE
jgi:transcriptional regulator with XRE-family HTH domain